MTSAQCPLYPREQASLDAISMSALGQKETSAVTRLTCFFADSILIGVKVSPNAWCAVSIPGT
jgi:hypothetical protein